MCGLVDPAHVSEELARDRSRVSDVGEVELSDGRFHDGMTDSSDGHVVYDWEALEVGVRTAVWLHRQYVVLPAAGAAGPSRFGRDETEPGAGLEFDYGVNEETGARLSVTPTVANTGTDGALGPHGFTRVLFRPQVLERYTSEPRRYTVTASRIECLHVWGLSIGRTSDALVEVDLYDLRTMARSELLHWQAHNVPPSGGRPDEGKFRRERLNNPASSPDPVRDLRAALTRANAVASNELGALCGANWSQAAVLNGRPSIHRSAKTEQPCSSPYWR